MLVLVRGRLLVTPPQLPSRAVQGLPFEVLKKIAEATINKLCEWHRRRSHNFASGVNSLTENKKND